MGRFFWVIVITAAVAFLNGIFQNIFGFDLFRHNVVNKLDYLNRIQSSFVDPNDFGTYIISVLPLTFLFLKRGFPGLRRIMLLAVCSLGFYCLLKTSSRGAWVGFLVGTSVYFFVLNKKFAIIVPIAVIILLMAMPNGFERVTGLFKAEKNTVWERTVLWKAAWGMIKQQPAIGLGVNTFSKHFPQYKPANYSDLRYAHNSYLQMWAEIGAAGLLLFLSIPILVLFRALRGIKVKVKQCPEGVILLGLIAGYLGFLVHSIFDNTLFSLMLTTLFWVMSAYIVVLNEALNKAYCE